jgi:hypothetical protein
MSEKPKLRRRAKHLDPNPPGEFLSEDLRHETARFLDEVKNQIERRKQHPRSLRLGPPRPPTR